MAVVVDHSRLPVQHAVGAPRLCDDVLAARLANVLLQRAASAGVGQGKGWESPARFGGLHPGNGHRRDKQDPKEDNSGEWSSWWEISSSRMSRGFRYRSSFYSRCIGKEDPLYQGNDGTSNWGMQRQRRRTLIGSVAACSA